VTDPNTGKSFVASKNIKNVQIHGGDVQFSLELGYPPRANGRSSSAR